MWTHNHLTTKQTNKKASKQANKLGNPARPILRGPCPPPYFRSNWGRQGPRKSICEAGHPFYLWAWMNTGSPLDLNTLIRHCIKWHKKRSTARELFQTWCLIWHFSIFFWLSRSVIDPMFTGNMIIHGYFLISLTAM